MSETSARILKLVLRVAITGVLLVVVLSRINPANLRRAAAEVRWTFLFVSWVITLAIFWANSKKMQLILRLVDCPVTMLTVYAVSAITLLYSLILPGLLSTSVKWYVLKKDTGKGAGVLSAMVYNQLSTIVVTTAVGLMALIFVNPADLFSDSSGRQWLLPTVAAVLFVLVVACFVLILYSKTGRHCIGLIEKLVHPLPTAVRRRAHNVLEQLSRFQNAGWRFHAVSSLITFFGHIGLGTLLYIAAAAAAGARAPVPILISLCAIIFVLGRVPISLANLGVREVTLIGVLRYYDVDAASALLMSMVLFSTVILMALLGAGFQLFWTPPGVRTQTQSA